jgi:hypothetical protein
VCLPARLCHAVQGSCWWAAGWRSGDIPAGATPGAGQSIRSCRGQAATATVCTQTPPGAFGKVTTSSSLCSGHHLIGQDSMVTQCERWSTLTLVCFSGKAAAVGRLDRFSFYSALGWLSQRQAVHVFMCSLQWLRHAEGAHAHLKTWFSEHGCLAPMLLRSWQLCG